jgi:hypothetical protein
MTPFFDAIGASVNAFLSAVINLFPTADSGIIATINGSLDSFKNYLGTASWLFPVNTFFLIVGLMITIELSLISYRTIKLLVAYISAGFLRG